MTTNDYSIVSAREAQLTAVARAGDASALIEYLYVELLPVRARKLARLFREQYGTRLEAEDITQAGAEWVLRSLDKALTALNPVAWLLRVAATQMLRYCKENCSVIRVPVSMQYAGKGHEAQRVPVVASLDAPLRWGEDLTLLDLLAEVA